MRLGLHPSPESIKYIFVGEAGDEQGTTPWYEWNFDANKAIPIHEDAITGQLTNIIVTPHEYKDNINYKINFHIMGDRKYVIRTGVGTTFSRGVLLALNTVIERYREMPPYITISIKPGDESEKAMFGSVFIGEDKMRPDWTEESLSPIIVSLQEELKKKNSNVVVQSTKELIDNKDLYWETVKSQREEGIKPPVEEAPKKRGRPAKA